MAAWRRKAFELFPDLRRDVERPDYSAGLLFIEHLLPAVREAHATNDRERLRKIYAYAEWCLRQTAKELWNSAGVCFYEHVFDGPQADWPRVIPWLSRYVVDNCWMLWEWGLGA